jgi:hypothetical protein
MWVLSRYDVIIIATFATLQYCTIKSVVPAIFKFNEIVNVRITLRQVHATIAAVEE